VGFPWLSSHGVLGFYLISSQDVQIDCPHLCITSFNAKTALEMFMDRFIKCHCAVLCHAGLGYGRIFMRSPFRRGIERTRHKMSERNANMPIFTERSLGIYFPAIHLNIKYPPLAARSDSSRDAPPSLALPLSSDSSPHYQPRPTGPKKRGPERRSLRPISVS
jgi:hypothetical protein